MGMIIFALGTVVPAILLGLAAAGGGLWPVLAILSIWAFKSAQAPLAIFAAPDHDPDIEFPATAEHATLLAVLHFVLLFIVIWAIGGASGLGVLERLAVLITGALYFAQISHPNALELIHNDDTTQEQIGKAVFSSLLYGPFASSYPLVHDVHAATDDDPFSAASGESFYAYCLRVTIGSARAGFAAENLRRAQTPPTGIARFMHPYVGYVASAGIALLVSMMIAGLGGLIALLAVSALTQMQVLLRFYVRHFGLRRAQLADGTFEPLGPQHNWGMTTRFSEALMLFALRLVDDRTSTSEHIKDLLSDEAKSPKLPHAPMVMYALALAPPKWHAAMSADLGAQLPDQPEHDPFTKLSTQDEIMARVLASQKADSVRPARPTRPAPMPGE